MKVIAYLAVSTLFLTGVAAERTASQGPVQAQSSAPLEGNVTDYKSGKPIAGLRITARVQQPDPTKTKPISAVSDAKGHFKIDGMPEQGIMFLKFNLEGGGSVEMGARAGDRNIEIRIRDESFHIMQVGDRVPKMDFKYWVNSKRLDVATLKGKPFVLDFWFVTCSPCVASLPSLEALSKKYEGRARVIGVHATFNLSAAQLKDFAVKHGVTYPLAMDHGGDAGIFYDRFITQGSPTVAVFDKDGKLVEINGSVADADAKLEELLDGK